MRRVCGPPDAQPYLWPRPLAFARHELDDELASERLGDPQHGFLALWTNRGAADCALQPHLYRWGRQPPPAIGRRLLVCGVRR